MPILNEKNACPIALKTTEEFILLKSGLNRNFKPSNAPSNVTERIPKTIRIKNNNGIMTFEARSIPFSTPQMIIICVMAINNNVQNIGR